MIDIGLIDMSNKRDLKEIIRKIQLMGGSSLVVSLPKNWVKNVGLKPGNYVYMVIEEDKSLRIFPTSSKRRKPVGTVVVAEKISMKEYGNYMVLREVMSRYLAGYELITIVFNDHDPENRRLLKEIISKKMIGVEVIDEVQDRITFQVLVSIEGLSANKIIQRMCYVTSGMLRDIITALENHDKKLLRDVIDRDDNIDKFYLYILRQLNMITRSYVSINKVGLSSVEEIPQYIMVAKSIERIADHAQKTASNLLKLVDDDMKSKEEVFNRIKRIIISAQRTFKDSVKAFMERKRELAHHLLNAGAKKFAENEAKWMNKVIVLNDIRMFALLRLILDSLQRITDYSMDIAEATIDLTVK